MALSRGRKLLVGCLALVATAVVVVVVATALFVRWVRTPGEPLEGSRLLDGATAVYAEVRLRPDDPGARDLVRSFLTASQRPSLPDDAQVPDAVRWIVGSVPRKEVTDREIDKVLPIGIVMRRQGGADGPPGPPLFAASFSKLGNSVRLIDMFFSWAARRDDDLTAETYGEETIYNLRGRGRGEGERGSLWVGFVGTYILVSPDLDAVRRGIDALGAPAPSAAPSLLAGRPEDASLFLSAEEGHGEALADLVAFAAAPLAEALRPALGGAGPVSLWGRLRPAGVMEGEVRIGEKAGAAPRGAPETGRTLSATLGGARLKIDLEPIPARPGERAAWRIEVEGLEAAMQISPESLRALERSAGRSR